MSTFKSLITIPSYPQGEISQPLVQGALPSVRKQDCEDVVMRQQRKGLMCRFGAFLRECGRRIRVMKAASDQAESGDGTCCRKRRADIVPVTE